MSVRSIRAALLGLPLLAASVAAVPTTVAAAACGVESPALGNGGFETPGVAPNSYELIDASLVPPWNTTDVSNQIEVWGDTFLDVPAFEGTSYAELNANSVGTLYQDVLTTPGATMNWSLHHRGRDGTDVMKVLIGDAATADVSSDAGWDAVSPDIADDPSAWGTASGSYVVPAGQTCTRFAFRAVSSVGGDSYGNLIDAIAFSIPVDAKPSPTGGQTPAVATKTARPHLTNPPTDAVAGTTRAPDGAWVSALVVALGVGLVSWAAALTRRRPYRRSRRR